MYERRHESASHPVESCESGVLPAYLDSFDSLSQPPPSTEQVNRSFFQTGVDDSHWPDSFCEVRIRESQRVLLTRTEYGVHGVCLRHGMPRETMDSYGMLVACPLLKWSDVHTFPMGLIYGVPPRIYIK